MAMDNGDKEYTLFYERNKCMLEDEKVLQFHFWAKKYIDSYIEEDFKSAFYDVSQFRKGHIILHT